MNKEYDPIKSQKAFDFFLLLIMCGVVWFASIMATMQITQINARNEAVKRGYAVWMTDRDGNTQFVWK